MKYAHIIYYSYLEPDGSRMSIGGIQTYLTNLIPVLRGCGYYVILYQRSCEDFHLVFDGYEVYGVRHKLNYCPQVAKALLKKVFSLIDFSQDLLVYGCETCITQVVPCKTIAIQHGISWDKPPLVEYTSWQYFKHHVGKFVLSWKIVNRVNKADYLVCVDNNFVNWHRAMTPYPKVRHIVIPNFAEIPASQPQKKGYVVSVIFARRLFQYRGTRLFANVVERILAKHKNVHITVAGTGPDESYMHEKLDRFSNVQFITYSSKDSLTIHADKDIAVIPTMGSEGTSLSLLEAMAAGCATICTNVGGMTNIVLDGYNGFMISPDENELYNALNTLIEDLVIREKLQNRAYETVKNAFSLDTWRKKWAGVIHQVSGE